MTVPHEQREALLAAGAERAEGMDQGEVAALLATFWRDLSTETLATLRPEDVLGAALSHRQLAERRRSDETHVRVFTPTVETDGWGTRNTVVQVVIEDMPFLVDSVSAALQDAGASVRFVTHPQMTVERDDEGHLLAVFPRDPDPRAGVDESWMHFEVPRTTDRRAMHRLEDTVRSTLDDIRSAYQGWPAMRRRAQEVADETAELATSGRADAHEATALLEWLMADQFVFLGYTLYRPGTSGDPEEVAEARLGILDHLAGVTELPLDTAEAREAWDSALLIVTKANARATVHRRTFMDLVVVKAYDDDGTETGSHRFIGLFTSSAYHESLTQVPYLMDKAEAVLEAAGFPADSHSGKALLNELENYPRDELFRCDVAELARNTLAIVQLREQIRTRLFLSRDPYGRFMSCLVYLPRDRYNTAARLEVSHILKERLDADTVDYTTRASESSLATLHFIVHMAPGRTVPEIDPADLENQIVEATRDWDEDLAAAMIDEFGEGLGDRYTETFRGAFPTAYKEVFPPRVGAADLRELEGIGADELRLNLYRTPTSPESERRLKVYSRGPLSLSAVLPIFTHLGTEVTGERPYVLERSDGVIFHVYDFGLRPLGAATWQGEDTRARFQEAFAAAWEGRTEADELDGLVLLAGLTSRQVVILRAVTAYLRQIGISYSQTYLRSVLLAHPDIAALMIELFRVRFDPDLFPSRSVDAQRRKSEDGIIARLDELVGAVPSLEEDRILRRYLGVIRGTLRTNYYQRAHESPHDASTTQPTVALKLAPATIPGMPEPHPLYEIWVYSPRVEGAHLRFGKVARGGLRWSERREDFRTEILGLVKAQTVKNAVIVPTGAKGGFYPKGLPDPAVDREGWASRGREAYQLFIAALLDLTDNFLDGAAVPPPRVVRHDSDDTYLVVAADKGTARFSDVANAIASTYGYWLDDAFASGGSTGYDHKAMGITAKGAWESVKRHFREMGRDIQHDDFTVVGIGDMSGDVFGNGMLLSPHIRLVAAFDHRDIFVDPDPDPVASLAERRRLFELTPSSWQDYDRALISSGGGVFSRSLKSIEISDPMRSALGLPAGVEQLSPHELIRSVLQAPVDLLWNGGVGTYVKATDESDAEIGDRANDPVRITGRELRVRAVGEGGNLGFSQLGRIEAARRGIHLNTDAIDNSAGVDTSDHEVNLKIPLSGLVQIGELTYKQRNRLLVEMTDEVARLVIEDNYEQNLLLGHSRERSGKRLGAYLRVIHHLEERGLLDRELEFLPADRDLHARERADEGLTSPERAVLLAYVKLALKQDINASGLPDDPWFAHELHQYFPHQILDRFPKIPDTHPLRREIITNVVANSVVNLGGMTFAQRAQEETGATMPEIARAMVLAREVFDIERFMHRVRALDNIVGTDVQARLHRESRRLLDRATRWILLERPATSDVGADIDRYRPAVAAFEQRMDELLHGEERERFATDAAEFTRQGVPEDLARWAVGLLDAFALLDITDLARGAQEDLTDVAELYFSVTEQFDVDELLTTISSLPRDELWDSLARSAVRADVYAAAKALTASVIDTTAGGSEVEQRLRQWIQDNAAAAQRAHRSLLQLKEIPQPGLAPVSVVLRHLRSVSRSGSAGSRHL
ncbi:NAD-glutamate dehydrogenase [Raineyella fluvialis]|uniref:NAD-glutamate dehydrogenase n=1 Tax=Raineyella fluvialis TaxID=2662261 RepID=A0A5Q2FCX7_9ACTN|nr:NAD-glutamate dehydrogenase [Raineyella fluvialis]QGF24638.1 NAD-glutamate dehydrogenase [Raineyella fluvialis]